MEYLRQSPCYKPSALAEWSRSDVADPWLVASAKTLGFTIITFETSNPNLNNYQPSKYAKIPDVARVFDVEVCNLFEMMNFGVGLTVDLDGNAPVLVVLPPLVLELLHLVAANFVLAEQGVARRPH